MDVIDQGINKRPGAFAAYIEVWHADVMTFLGMKRVKGSTAGDARKLFYALWVNDLL